MEINILSVQNRYINVKETFQDKLQRLCDMLKITPCYIPSIISSTLNMMDEYILKHYKSSEQDSKNCSLRINIIALACLWIATKFHDDLPLYAKDIEYITHINWKLIVKEEIKVLYAIKYRICKFMLEEHNPLREPATHNLTHVFK